MGTWGTAIFSDDTACEVRDDWRTLVGDGLTPSDATDRLILQWKESLTDPDERPVFWLSLAATQWKAGRLEDRVKKAALAIMANGSDLERWKDDPGLLRKRVSVLAGLREQLESPQPNAARIRKVVKAVSPWDPGTVVSYRLRSGKFVLFRVVGLASDKGGTYPYCRFFDWIGSEVPAERTIRAMRFKNGVAMICGSGKRDFPSERLSVIKVQLPPPDPFELFGIGVWLWKLADQRLRENWGYE